jgi:phosphoribosylanthranilate isomerase
VRYPFLIAGGINAENARRLLTESGAIGIDLSSGVESAPGEKDPRKLEDLFRVMR